ncbi:hypothetical protein D7V80_36145 [Corallococcus sp. CA054B]|uniref:S1 family peptidase n=1 Tax=Corallococcus sp. CA054B TaxID=2316734 RepID=UPI000EA1BBE3|nr:S1 family peptidase [Corallococcus sp. CA054B]RKG60147.1 hypothetical protein D7V80_36145 [Corallococcus sp. CA054B]
MYRRPHPVRTAVALFATVVLPTSALAQTEEVSPEVLTAMQRDLGLSAAQARQRLTTEALAARTEQTLRDELGASFGGAWLSEKGDRLIVGVTTTAGARAALRAGAEPRWVSRTQKELDALKASLDRGADVASKDIQGWYVDVITNSVVVLAEDAAVVNAERFIAESGAADSAVRVVISHDRPRLAYDLRGGDPYYMNNGGRCSVGFSVAGGFVTAGHCGVVNTFTWGYNGVGQGLVRGTSFPGNDYGWVQVSWDWTPQPWVNNYSGTNAIVAGSAEAGINASVCRSGSTSGWRCGVILAKNYTANYPEGAVSGLTAANVCVNSGDSGGSWIWGNQAQGVTSGGVGFCPVGGSVALFQPVNEILSAYGLSLTTNGGSEIVGLNGKCIDVASANTADGTPIQLWDCNGTNAQKWTFHSDGTLRAFGKCLDVTWSSPTNGTPLQLWYCNGTNAQKFAFNDAGNLVNPLGNLCVTAMGWNGGDGTPLQTWDCTGAANQKWAPR